MKDYRTECDVGEFSEAKRIGWAGTTVIALVITGVVVLTLAHFAKDAPQAPSHAAVAPGEAKK